MIVCLFRLYNLSAMDVCSSAVVKCILICGVNNIKLYSETTSVEAFTVIN